MRRLFFLKLMFILGFLCSCVSVRSVTVNQIPAAKNRKRVVESYASAPIVLGIPFDSGYPAEAQRQLVEQCRDSRIEGVLTKFVSTWYYLFSIDAVKMRGYCIERS